MESVAASIALPRPRFGAASVHPATVLAWVLSSAAAAAFVALALVRYTSFNSTAFDLGFFDQVVWQISHGHPGVTSYLYYYDFFGQHLEPVLYAYGAFYRLWADPRLLLVSQGLALGAAGVILFACCRQVTRPWPSLSVTMAFLLAVPLHNALAFDFHPEALSALPVFGGLWLALRRHPWAAVACWGSLILLKEDESLVLPALGLLLLLLRDGGDGRSAGGLVRRAAPSLVLALGGLVWGVVAIGVVEPHWRHGYPGDLTRDYAAFGGGVGAALSTIIQHPRVVTVIALGDGGLAALWDWIGGTGFTALLAPLGLVAAAPALLLQLGSARPPQHLLRLHYGIEAVPLIFVYLVLELQWLRSHSAVRDALAHAAGGLAVLGFILASPYASLSPPAQTSAEHVEAIQGAIRLVPANETLRADSTLAAHLSQRERIQEFPGSDWADFVALDGHAYHPAPLRESYEAAVRALPGQGYVEIYNREGVQVWRR